MSDIKEQIRAITDNILADYRKGRYIDRPDTFNQPDKAVVEDIIGKVQKLIFPGFFKAQTYRYYTRDNSTSTLVEDILFNLTRQIALTLRYRKEYERQEACFLTSRAQEISLKFLSGIPRIRALIETDLEAEFEGDPAAENKDDIIFSYPGLGNLAVSAITSCDYYLIQGYVLWIAVIYMVINLLVDMSYYLVDPRMRLKE